MNEGSYRDIDPYSGYDKLRVSDALKRFRRYRNMELKFPLSVRLAENPSYTFFGRNLVFIPGAVSELIHDVIHIMIGRGFLPEDEAFVIGFTVGSTGQWNIFSSAIYHFVAKFTYPKAYKFNRHQLEILELAVKAGEKLASENLSNLVYSEVKDMTVKEMRSRYVKEWTDLECYYIQELRNSKGSPAHVRLAINLEKVSLC